MFLRTPVIFQFHHSNSFKKLFTLRKTQHSSNHKHSSLHKILHPQPSRLAPSEKYSLLQTYHMYINFPFQNKYKTPVFYTFCWRHLKIPKDHATNVMRQMLCEKCSKNDVTLIPKNADVIWREKYVGSSKCWRHSAAIWSLLNYSSYTVKF
jgi:hypothetical protein